MPAAYTIRKLKVGDFCNLHHFPNEGLENAKAAVLVAEPDALVPAAAVKDSKASAIVKDKNLTWEEFNEAVPRMITMMKTQDWPDDCVHMHIQFWHVTRMEFRGNQSKFVSRSERRAVQ
ncbi:hypothetical protein BDR06DRAFT_975789 [Suillus hirtellus]|nr:hypothetical protein BDR06DRAFT_975789 [Suillus hirtellus]